jgi:beta-galactosidase
VTSAGAPARVALVPDRTRLSANGEDLSFITVRIEDEAGNLCPMADNLVKFEVTGPARIAGVDNGNAASLEPFQADHRQAFNGLALAIVRTQNGQAGTIRIVASSEGLRTASTTLTSARP